MQTFCFSGSGLRTHRKQNQLCVSSCVYWFPSQSSGYDAAGCITSHRLPWQPANQHENSWILQLRGAGLSPWSSSFGLSRLRVGSLGAYIPFLRLMRDGADEALGFLLQCTAGSEGLVVCLLFQMS